MSLQTQLRLEAFYSFNQRFAKIRSKRIQKAVTRITGHMSSELMDIPEVDRLTTSQKASKVKRKKSKNDSNKKKPGHQSSNTGECKELLELQELVADADKEMRPMGRGRGRGRSRGKGRGVKASNGGSSKTVQNTDSETSISAESSSEDLQEEENFQNGCDLSGELRRVWCFFIGKFDETGGQACMYI